MRQNQVHNVNYLKDRRRSLRNNMTPAEAALWSVLKNNGFKNRKFRRQHSIGNYIVDFYCATEKIIVELDGQSHFTTGQAYYDVERDKQLTDLGNKILRFENKLVFEDLDTVLMEIERHFRRG
jgi:very-short-patch-repair endonuclease